MVCIFSSLSNRSRCFLTSFGLWSDLGKTLPEHITGFVLHCHKGVVWLFQRILEESSHTGSRSWGICVSLSSYCSRGRSSSRCGWSRCRPECLGEDLIHLAMHPLVFKACTPAKNVSWLVNKHNFCIVIICIGLTRYLGKLLIKGLVFHQTHGLGSFWQIWNGCESHHCEADSHFCKIYL